MIGRSLLLSLDLSSKNSLFEDGSVIMASNDGVEQVISLGTFSLRDLMGCSLESDKGDTGEELFEAGMLLVSEPGVTS